MASLQIIEKWHATQTQRHNLRGTATCGSWFVPALVNDIYHHCDACFLNPTHTRTRTTRTGELQRSCFVVEATFSCHARLPDPSWLSRAFTRSIDHLGSEVVMTMTCNLTGGKKHPKAQSTNLPRTTIPLFSLSYGSISHSHHPPPPHYPTQPPQSLPQQCPQIHPPPHPPSQPSSPTS